MDGREFQNYVRWCMGAGRMILVSDVADMGDGSTRANAKMCARRAGIAADWMAANSKTMCAGAWSVDRIWH